MTYALLYMLVGVAVPVLIVHEERKRTPEIGQTPAWLLLLAGLAWPLLLVLLVGVVARLAWGRR